MYKVLELHADVSKGEWFVCVLIPCSEVTLNGQLLQMDGASLPSLTPKQESASDTVFLPALSFGFYVFKSAGAAACK